MSTTRRIFVLHGKGGSPEGSSKKLQTCLEQQEPELHGLFTRPQLFVLESHGSGRGFSSGSGQVNIPERSLVIGISVGGLLAAKLQ